jgi:hypothetical protein
MADTRQRAGGQDHRRRGEEPESTSSSGSPVSRFIPRTLGREPRHNAASARCSDPARFSISTAIHLAEPQKVQRLLGGRNRDTPGGRRPCRTI